ncbi:MAG: hypothetical protein E6G21_05955 [Actinobacteria bacterium]|nr:MAG: hypothetical protein E6G25_02445 [Actinomycetota bacterium]TML52091.1 MAG: hypothetical protein E6G21_05955 [Actinomycetota bacterium]
MVSDAFSHDRFLVDQLIRPVANLYRVTPLAIGETPAGGPIAFVRQKKLAVKEDIRFYGDEQEKQELFRIKARSVFDTGGARYDVTAADGGPIGVLHHQLKSLIRSTWRVTDADDHEVAIAQERSLPLAIARRVIDFVPYGEWIPIPYNFDLLSNGRAIGHLSRKFQLRDRYVLDLSGDSDRRVDRRLAIALAIGLDTLQNR